MSANELATTKSVSWRKIAIELKIPPGQAGDLSEIACSRSLPSELS